MITEYLGYLIYFLSVNWHSASPVVSFVLPAMLLTRCRLASLLTQVVICRTKTNLQLTE